MTSYREITLTDLISKPEDKFTFPHSAFRPKRWKTFSERVGHCLKANGRTPNDLNTDLNVYQ
jgi:hypothetical protein